MSSPYRDGRAPRTPPERPFEKGVLVVVAVLLIALLGVVNRLLERDRPRPPTADGVESSPPRRR